MSNKVKSSKTSVTLLSPSDVPTEVWMNPAGGSLTCKRGTATCTITWRGQDKPAWETELLVVGWTEAPHDAKDRDADYATSELEMPS